MSLGLYTKMTTKLPQSDKHFKIQLSSMTDVQFLIHKITERFIKRYLKNMNVVLNFCEICNLKNHFESKQFKIITNKQRKI